MRAWLVAALLFLLWGPAARAEEDWPMPRRDLHNSARVSLNPRSGAAPKAWQFQASSHVRGYQPGMAVWSSPAVGLVKGEAVVLVGSYDHNIYALDALSGARRWRFTTGGGVYHSPILWNGPGGETFVFAGSSDRALYALDGDSGRRRWVHTVESWRPTMGGARLSAPCMGRVAGQAAVFLGHWVWDKSLSGHMQAGGVTAVDALSGKKLWHAQLGDNQISAPLFVSLKDKGRLFVASQNGNLYALDAEDGKQLWAYTDRDAILGSPAFIGGARPRVVVGSKYGRVRCLDALSGQEIWRFRTGHWVDATPAVLQQGGRSIVLVGSYDMHLYALDGQSGRELWRYQTAGGVYGSVALAEESALVPSWDHHLHSISLKDGSLRWSAYLGRPLWDSITLGDSVWSSPVVATINGAQVAFVGSYGGPFYAIPLAEAAKKSLARPTANIDFWITMPIVMLLVTVATLLATRHRRRRQARG